jgi:hypothetical protein
VSRVIENRIAHVVIGNVVIQGQLGVSFARQIERQSDGDTSERGMDWIELVGMPVEQLDSGRDVTRFVEGLRGQRVGGNDPDQGEERQHSGENYGPP